MKNFIKENWFKIALLILLIVLVNIISITLSQNRKANILMFCVTQYDKNAVGSSPNTWFGFPDNCLAKFNSQIQQ